MQSNDDKPKGNTVDMTAHKEAEALEMKRQLCLGCGNCHGQQFYILQSGEAQCAGCNALAGGITVLNSAECH